MKREKHFDCLDKNETSQGNFFVLRTVNTKVFCFFFKGNTEGYGNVLLNFVFLVFYCRRLLYLVAIQREKRKGLKF